jgi:hypothetical protein
MLLELRGKAKLYEETGMITGFDASAAVIKSDTIVSAELRKKLRHAVTVLEEVPEEEKDWHPRSDGQVLDLVHPSLWPLVYGRSRIAPDKSITLDNCLEHCGYGEVIPEPTVNEHERSAFIQEYNPNMQNPWSRKFQWLPCDVEINGGTPKIVSYINNLHPVHHRDLYNVVETVLQQVLPLWDLVYRWPKDFDRVRIPCRRVGKRCTVPDICLGKRRYGCHMTSRPLEDGEEKRPEGREYHSLGDSHPLVMKDSAWFDATHPLEQPEPSQFDEAKAITAGKLRYFNFFPTSEYGTPKELGWPVDRIQVIVKLANIHLTPEKPTYDGGAWHVEGQLNEHICATAIYYYDSHNITPSHLAFRTRADREDLMWDLGYEQDDYHAIMGTFGINAKGNTLQELGKVLTSEGRLIAFPNVYQHRVAPFELKDKSKPGHRKILALFLVDPEIPIISTANVPPQQEHWWPADDKTVLLDWPISLKEAKDTRIKLMDERTAIQSDMAEALRNDKWNFCEH